MKPFFLNRNITKLLWLCLVVSLGLIGWQTFAYFTGKIPHHILPLVVQISGTQEAIPMAYSWTIKLALLSIMGLAVSVICLLMQIVLQKHEQAKL